MLIHSLMTPPTSLASSSMKKILISLWRSRLSTVENWFRVSSSTFFRERTRVIESSRILTLSLVRFSLNQILFSSISNLEATSGMALAMIWFLMFFWTAWALHVNKWFRNSSWVAIPTPHSPQYILCCGGSSCFASSSSLFNSFRLLLTTLRPRFVKLLRMKFSENHYENSHKIFKAFTNSVDLWFIFFCSWLTTKF